MSINKPTYEELKNQILTYKESQKYLNTIFNSIGDAVIATDAKGAVTRMNPVAEQLTGWREQEATGKDLNEVFRIVDEKSGRNEGSPFDMILTTGVSMGLPVHTSLVRKGGNKIPIASSGSPIMDDRGKIIGVVLVFRDQTEERMAQNLIETRLSLIEYASDHSLSELMVHSLDTVGFLVNSPIGFYHFVNPDQKTLSLQQWSSRTTKEFCRAEKQGLHYTIDQAGVWVDCVYEKRPVIHNDYKSLPHRKGLPEGHADIVRELVVPVIREDKVVAILGVGNKHEDYTNKDAEVVSYLADVTWEIVNQKRVEEAVKDREDRLSKIMKAANDGMWDWDLLSDEVYFDPRYYQMAGYEVDDFPHRLEEFQNRVHPNHVAHVMDQAEKHLKGEIDRFIVEFKFRKKQGDWIWIMGRGIIVERDESGKPLRFVGTHTDITERKMAEEALRESEQNFSDIFQTVSEGIAYTSMKGKVLSINNALLNILKVPREEIVGKNVLSISTKLLTARNAKRVIPILKSIISGKDAHQFQVDYKDKVLEVSAYINNVSKRITGVIRDITEQKKVEQELRKHREHLEELVKERTREIEEKNKELERFNRLFVGREFRIKELRDRIKELEQEIRDLKEPAEQ